MIIKLYFLLISGKKYYYVFLKDRTRQTYKKFKNPCRTLRNMILTYSAMLALDSWTKASMAFLTSAH